jgi:hypothetical protein
MLLSARDQIIDNGAVSCNQLTRCKNKGKWLIDKAQNTLLEIAIRSMELKWLPNPHGTLAGYTNPI